MLRMKILVKRRKEILAPVLLVIQTAVKKTVKLDAVIRMAFVDQGEKDQGYQDVTPDNRIINSSVDPDSSSVDVVDLKFSRNLLANDLTDTVETVKTENSLEASANYQDSRVRLEAVTGSLASCNVHIEEMNNVHQDEEHTGTRAFEDLDGRELCHTDEALVSSSFDYSALGEHKQKGIEGSPEIEESARRKHSGDYASLKFPAQNSTSSRDLIPNDSSSMDPNSNFGVRKMGGGAGRSTSLKFVYKRRTDSEGSGGNVEEYATNINDHHDSGMDLPIHQRPRSTRSHQGSCNDYGQSSSTRSMLVNPAGKLPWLMLSKHEDGYRYIPQLGDEVGHQEYLKLVKNSDEGPWGPWESIKENIKVAEICKVESLDYASLPGSGESCCKINLRFVDHSSAILEETGPLGRNARFGGGIQFQMKYENDDETHLHCPWELREPSIVDDPSSCEQPHIDSESKEKLLRIFSKLQEKSRLENDYYTSLEAVKHDIMVMMSNAQHYWKRNELQARIKHISKRGNLRGDWLCSPVTSSIVVLPSTPNSCFRPPPKVDSFVVRIEPRKPALQVNQKEWYGFLRICFNRKNKTLGSIFRQKSVINLLEKNYKTLQALNHATAQEKDTNDVMEFMDEDMGTDGVNAEGEISEFKKKVLDVLKKSGFEGERSSKLKLQQFLRPTFPV
ncbi:hypothetical protein C1H46_004260 [Malus baccata]|uniref:BRWD/PHIP ancillary-like domain-containing protein n=1 Tax=Malus baccata TaxID=106549 RepID=A0A540NHU7_MALBA|nr:hypothetical protein C1H46_004260 [Malus baccata]